MQVISGKPKRNEEPCLQAVLIIFNWLVRCMLSENMLPPNSVFILFAFVFFVFVVKGGNNFLLMGSANVQTSEYMLPSNSVLSVCLPR